MRRAIRLGLIAVVVVGAITAVYSSSVMYGTNVASASPVVADVSVGTVENSGSMGCEWALAGLTVLGGAVFMFRPRRRTM